MRGKLHPGRDRYRHLSDRGLVALMARNDECALDALYTRYGHLSYGLALRVLRDRVAAQRITCESFLELWRSAPGLLADAGSIRGRLLAAVQRRARQALGASGADRPIDCAPVEDRPAWVHEERSDGEATLAQLREGDREVMELAFYEGLNRAEIAERLGVSVATVTRRIVTGMQTLQQIESVRLGGDASGTG